MPIYTELTKDSNFSILPRENDVDEPIYVDSDSDFTEDGGEGTSSRVSRPKVRL